MSRKFIIVAVESALAAPIPAYAQPTTCSGEGGSPFEPGRAAPTARGMGIAVRLFGFVIDSAAWPGVALESAGQEVARVGNLSRGGRPVPRRFPDGTFGGCDGSRRVVDLVPHRREGSRVVSKPPMSPTTR